MARWTGGVLALHLASVVHAQPASPTEGASSPPAAPVRMGQGPFLGIITEEIPQAARIVLGIEMGVRVVSVVSGSPAAGKVLEGDIVLAVGGKPISDPAALLDRSTELPLEKPVSLTVRHGKSDIVVGVAPMPTSYLVEKTATGARALVDRVYVDMTFAKKAATGASSPPGGRGGEQAGSGVAFLGVSVGDNPEAATMEENGLPRGAMIHSVLPGSAAQTAGVQIGDIVSWVKGRPIQGPADLTGTIATMSPGETVQIVVRRGEQQISMNVALGSR